MYTLDIKKNTEACIQWIKNWFANDSGCAEGIIVGISGGKDSAVVATLCAKAIGKDRVCGVLMPNGYQEDIDDAVKVIKHLGIRSATVNIGKICSQFDCAIDSEFGGCPELTEESKINIPPRVRMTVLYALGQSMKYRVAGTGNASEHLVGYFTKWGDGACDFNPIENFTKEEVVEIGLELGLPPEIVNKTPSDGLCGKTDEEKLGISYSNINRYIRQESTDGEDISKEVLDKIIEKMRRNSHKNNSIPSFEPIFE